MVTNLVLSTFCYKADGSCEARNVSYRYSLCVCMKVKLFDQLLNTFSIQTILLDKYPTNGGMSMGWFITLHLFL